MKKLAIAVLSALLILTSCDAIGTYKLDDVLPPLIDISTQYPYVQSILIERCADGNTEEFTEASDLDNIHMQLEGIKAIREKDDGSTSPQYNVTFITTDGEVSIGIISDEAYIMDGYVYTIMRSGIDIFFFDSLFQ